MFHVTFRIDYRTAYCIADSHSLIVDYTTRGELGTCTLSGTRANVREVIELCKAEGVAYTSNAERG